MASRAVASTDDTALLEQTPGKMRVWIDDALVERPAVTATLSFFDTGWSDISTGGVIASGEVADSIPVMTDYTTSGVTMSASSEDSLAWKASDNDKTTKWASNSIDTGWLKVDFGAGNTQRIRSFKIQEFRRFRISEF